MAANQEALHAPHACFQHPRARNGQQLLVRPRLFLRLPVGRPLPVRRQLRLTPPRPKRQRALGLRTQTGGSLLSRAAAHPSALVRQADYSAGGNSTASGATTAYDAERWGDR